MKQTDVYGLGNALVDIPIQVPLQALDDLSLPAGSSLLMSADEQARLLEHLKNSYPSGIGALTAAGSVANSVITIADLSGSTGLATRLSNDEYGQFYERELNRLNVKLGNPLVIGGATGTSVVLITPDGERTMRTCLGVSAEIGPDAVSQDMLKLSKWLFVEGYLFANGAGSRDAIYKAVDLAKQPAECERAKVALTLSDKFIVDNFRTEIEKIIDRTDLIFANRRESMAFTGESTPEAAIQALGKIVPNVVVTAGSKGAYIVSEGREIFVPATPCKPIDTTGAGDAFAAGYLYGINNGYAPEDAARGAAYLAAKVVQVYGARLASGVRDAWSEGTK